ncbi:hypothetical protein [Pseudomonas sp. EA_35y_Pfl2_R5]|uniref:hypothetical protein n=1 Tax=Pseudomonas sp. EA_35y_Pfl2_R5 TaxID=3088690 RepID=UPI0030D9D322
MQGINGLRIGMLLLTLGLALGCASGGAQQQAGVDKGYAMAVEWTQLRQAKGHFAGGEWREDLDAWQGRKHQLMQALAAEVLVARGDTPTVLALLGEPDAKVTVGQADYVDWQRRTEWQGNPGPLLWSYHWRGQHDQLLVAFSEGRVSAVGWLYAWE